MVALTRGVLVAQQGPALGEPGHETKEGGGLDSNIDYLS